MGSDCWNGFFRATRKGVLSVNNFFGLRQLLFDRWVACANLLQCSTHSALVRLNKKARVWKTAFRAPKAGFFFTAQLGRPILKPQAAKAELEADLQQGRAELRSTQQVLKALAEAGLAVWSVLLELRPETGCTETEEVSSGSLAMHSVCRGQM